MWTRAHTHNSSDISGACRRFVGWLIKAMAYHGMLNFFNITEDLFDRSVKICHNMAIFSPILGLQADHPASVSIARPCTRTLKKHTRLCLFTWLYFLPRECHQQDAPKALKRVTPISGQWLGYAIPLEGTLRGSGPCTWQELLHQWKYFHSNSISGLYKRLLHSSADWLVVCPQQRNCEKSRIEPYPATLWLGCTHAE